MQEQIISFETAKLAKEKGFISYKNLINFPNNKKDFEKSNLSIPQSLLQKWLREVHGIHIEILLSDNNPYNEFYYRIMKIGEYFTLSHSGIYKKTYGEALETGLIEVLKLI